MGVHVLPILNPPPTSFPNPSFWSSQCTSAEHPVSCIKTGLAICFTYVKYTCFNAILSNHPTRTFSHRVQQSVLYICVSFAVSKKQIHYFTNKGLYRQGYGFSSSHVWMWELDLWRKLNTEELMLLNCGVGEDSWESLGLQGDQTTPS